MKKNSTTQSAFFNVRVLIGLFTALPGVILVLLGFGTFAGPAASIAQTQQSYTATNLIDPLVPAGFDCCQRGVYRFMPVASPSWSES